MGIEVFMQAIGIAIPSGEAIHRDKAPDGRIQVARPQVVEASIGVKELACVQMSIGCHAGFVKEISKGVVGGSIADDCAVVDQGAGAAKSIIIGRAILGKRWLINLLPIQWIPIISPCDKTLSPRLSMC